MKQEFDMCNTTCQTLQPALKKNKKPLIVGPLSRQEADPIDQVHLQTWPDISCSWLQTSRLSWNADFSIVRAVCLLNTYCVPYVFPIIQDE